MKTQLLKIFSFSLALLLSSCAGDPLVLPEKLPTKASPFELLKKHVAQGGKVSDKDYTKFQPKIIEVDPSSVGEISDRDCSDLQDCCCTCEGTIEFLGTTPSNLPWQLDIVVSCPGDEDWTSNGYVVASFWSNTASATENFPVVDGQDYHFVATIGLTTGTQTLNVDITDAAGTTPLSIPDVLSVGFLNCPLLTLYCKEYVGSNCYYNNVRICCTE